MTIQENWNKLKNWLEKEKKLAHKEMSDAVGIGFATNRMHRETDFEEVIKKMEEIESSN